MSGRLDTLAGVLRIMRACSSEKMGSCRSICRALPNEGEAAALTSYQRIRLGTSPQTESEGHLIAVVLLKVQGVVVNF